MLPLFSLLNVHTLIWLLCVGSKKDAVDIDATANNHEDEEQDEAEKEAIIAIHAAGWRYGLPMKAERNSSKAGRVLLRNATVKDFPAEKTFKPRHHHSKRQRYSPYHDSPRKRPNK